MPITGQSFKVGDSATLTSLDAFLKTNANRDAQVLGKRNDKTGEITLYIASKPSSLMDRILGRTERRQERAREGIQQVFSRFEKDTSATRGYSESGKAGSDLLFQHLGQVLNYKAGDGGGITAMDVRTLATAAKEITRALPTATGVTTVQANTGPTLATVGMTGGVTIPGAAKRLATAIASGADGNSVADDLGDRIAQRFRSNNRGESARTAFGQSDGAALRSELRTAIKIALDAQPGGPVLSEQAISDFADRAFNRAASQMLPDRAVDGTSTPTPSVGGKLVNLPNIRLGSEEYKPTGFLGEGGFANVYEYTSVNDPTLKTAFKLAKDTSPDAIADVAAEITAHKAAFGDGSSRQVIGLEGAVRLPDGRLGIAVEIAPNGTVYDISTKIREAIDPGPNPPPGKITAEEANIIRLTMVKDMALGLRHLHGSQKMTHYDFKSPNCMIGADGTTKVVDFGLSLKGTTIALETASTVDLPLFKAPEIMRAENVRKRIGELNEETAEVETRKQTAKLRELLPLAFDDTLQSLASNIMEPRKAQLEQEGASDTSMLFFDRKVDVWGLGASALHLFTGDLPMKDDRFMSGAQEKLEAFGANRNSEPLGNADAGGQLPPGVIGLRTGDAAVDRMMTRMLRPDPRDRSTPLGILNSSALQRDGVGSNEAKALIVALRSGDATRIANARQALAAVM